MDLVQSLDHPNIAKFVGAWLASSKSARNIPIKISGQEPSIEKVYFVQEHLAGGTLTSILSQQMLRQGQQLYSDLQATGWCLGIAQALEYLHDRPNPILHRDLNCNNVLLDGKNLHYASTKLVDFGLHKVIQKKDLAKINPDKAPDTENSYPTQEEDDDDATLSKTLSKRDLDLITMTGCTGCYMYMAPEVILCQQYDEKCDIYSFACIMFELFARRLRIFDVHHTLTEERIERHAFKLASGYRPEFPSKFRDDIKDIVSECWHQDPQMRPNAGSIGAKLRIIHNELLMKQEQQAQRKCFMF
eukprot:TRINITY_DN2546_c0_g1_i1.p1 TRINITY_DN2546_c0_g1~~TRINITY_DN2546_c0_g1_i1.p1  ORF type:complete len:302 (-),score=35.67 TRINITY_DN2546_c0_g1_i1:2169-3074(-)